MKSKSMKAKTILPVRCTLLFSEVCREQSKCYPIAGATAGAKRSAARFLKEAAKEKLENLGYTKAYIKSLC